MFKFIAQILLFALFSTIKCDQELSLKILKCTDESFTPVSSIIEERVGANFSLFCDLVSSVTNNKYYDFHISWFKQPPPNDVQFWREHGLEDLNTTQNTNYNTNTNNNNNNNNNNGKKTKKSYSILASSEMNKAVKQFQPLKLSDRGKYICVSLKYNLLEAIEIVVRDERPRHEDLRPIQETFFCTEQMFRCLNGFCIIHHYACDGKADCKDGSDESLETCKGDPCREKLHCDDGRCIPMSWCCDRHHDPNCTVTNRPRCCQALSESYDELEYGSPSNTVSTQSHNGARYIFISVCIFSILFVIAIMLIFLSRFMLLAKKTNLRHHPHRYNNHNHNNNNNNRNNSIIINQRHLNFESIALNPSAANQMEFLNNCENLCNVYTYQNNLRTLNTSSENDVSEPLLFPINCNNLSIINHNSNNNTGGNSGANNNSSNNSGVDLEQPPSYIEVVRLNLNLNEPPPPYTSTEALNLNLSEDRI